MGSVLITTPGRERGAGVAAEGGAAVCQHRFAGQPHYCTYIHPDKLVAALYPARNADEQLVISFLADCGLWWHLQANELAVVARALTSGQPLAVAQEQVVLQRLERCIALGQIMGKASALVRRYLIIPAPHVQVGFHIQGELRAIPLLRDLDALTARLQASPAFLADGSLPALTHRLREYVVLANDGRRGVEHLLATFQDHSLPGVALASLLPEEVLAWSSVALQRHHPQALADPSVTRPRLFIGAHEQFEVFFPATICALEEAITRLIPDAPQVMQAASLIQRAADSVALWQDMIHVPQTMTAADYIGVREQLGHGSGAESLQLRWIEILAGLRHRSYRKRLRKMQLWTPRLEVLWQALSLNEAILQVLAARGMLSLEARPSAQAAQIAAILRPVGTDHPHADLAALCQAALNLDGAGHDWRQAQHRCWGGAKPPTLVAWTASQDCQHASYFFTCARAAHGTCCKAPGGWHALPGADNAVSPLSAAFVGLGTSTRTLASGGINHREEVKRMTPASHVLHPQRRYVEQLVVAVITGSHSDERYYESSPGIIGALLDKGYAVERYDVDDPNLLSTLRKRRLQVVQEGKDRGVWRELVAWATGLGVGGGEDGTLAALFEQFLPGMPYVGSSAGACMLALDKAHSKVAFRAAGLSVPDGICFFPSPTIVGSWRYRVIHPADSDCLTDEGQPHFARLAERLGLPLVVKPNGGGASQGLSLVSDAATLACIFPQLARRYGPVLVEQHVPSPRFDAEVEYSVPVLEGTALPAFEICAPTIYDTATKISGSEAHPISGELAERLREAAWVAFRALRMRGFARFDFRVTPAGNILLLEGNEAPGLIEKWSLFAKAGDAIGLSFEDLIERCFLTAFTPHPDTTPWIKASDAPPFPEAFRPLLPELPAALQPPGFYEPAVPTAPRHVLRAC
jgi:D-alanine-D-alanine ligase